MLVLIEGHGVDLERVAYIEPSSNRGCILHFAEPRGHYIHFHNMRVKDVVSILNNKADSNV